MGKEEERIFFKELPKKFSGLYISPSGIEVRFVGEFNALAIRPPSDWKIVRIATLFPDIDADAFVHEVLVHPPGWRIEPCDVLPGYANERSFLPVRLAEAWVTVHIESENLVGRFPIGLDFAEGFSRDPLSCWPEIAEDTSNKLIELNDEARSGRTELLPDGTEIKRIPPPYRLLAAESKGSLRGSREKFLKALSLVEKVCNEAATRASLAAQPALAHNISAAISDIEYYAMARESNAHALGIYGQLSRLVESEWNYFGLSVGGHKAKMNSERQSQAAGLAREIKAAAKELQDSNECGSFPADRVLKRMKSKRNSDSDSRKLPSARTVQRYLVRLIDDDELAADRFRVRLKKTDT
jgi:hypothetical protein